MSYMDSVQKLKNAALDPAGTVAKSMKETEKEAFGCFPIYVPEEIIYASGLLPVGMWGGNTELKLVDRYLQSFCCSVMRSNMEYGMRGTYDMLKGIILPTFCDTLKCICENWKVAVPNIPIVPIVYPQNRSLNSGLIYMIEEFKRVKEEIEKLTGRSINDADVEAAWSLYEEYRQIMRELVKVISEHPDKIGSMDRHLIIKAGYFMDKKIYMGEIKKIINGLSGEKKNEFDGIRIVATGLLAEPVELLNIFDENKISIVADDLAQESRQFRTVGRQSGNVWENLAHRIQDQQGDTFLFEAEKTRGNMLIEMIKEYNADAVVVFMMKFCDPEEFDYPIYKRELEEKKVPILYLETEQQLDSFEQVRTRIQSFAEMLM